MDILAARLLLIIVREFGITAATSGEDHVGAIPRRSSVPVVPIIPIGVLFARPSCLARMDGQFPSSVQYRFALFIKHTHPIFPNGQ